MNGFGVIEWADGRRFLGSFLKDKKEGKGIFFWPNGIKFYGDWVGGK